jgi:ABC-2 type transport system permease protein
MNLSAFMHLVKHEARWNIGANKGIRWGLIYGIAGLILGLTFFTYAVLNGYMKLQYMMFYGYGLPFVIMPIAFTLINKEWKNRTYGWWLSLPYSRVWLLLCKWIGTLLQMLKVYLLFMLGIIVFTLYAMILTGDYSMATLYDQLKTAFKYLLFLLVIFPVIASYGLLTGVIAQTKLKPLMPLMWLVMVLSINLFIQLINSGFAFGSEGFKQDTSSFAASDLSMAFIPVFIVSLLLGWIIIQFSAKLLSKHLTI